MKEWKRSWNLSANSHVRIFLYSFCYNINLIWQCSLTIWFDPNALILHFNVCNKKATNLGCAKGNFCSLAGHPSFNQGVQEWEKEVWCCGTPLMIKTIIYSLNLGAFYGPPTSFTKSHDTESGFKRERNRDPDRPDSALLDCSLRSSILPGAEAKNNYPDENNQS